MKEEKLPFSCCCCAEKEAATTLSRTPVPGTLECLGNPEVLESNKQDRGSKMSL